MGRKRKDVLNKHKICSTKYCNNQVNRWGTDNYCTECRKAINYRRWLKSKGLFEGNYLYVYMDKQGQGLYCGLTHNYKRRHKEHLESDKRFVVENTWHSRVVYEFSEEITLKELEYLEYILIQYHLKRSELLENKQKIRKNDYILIDENRKKELKKMLCSEMIKNNVVDFNAKKNSLFGDKELEELIS